MFIPDLYDLATPYVSVESTPYEVPVQTLHHPLASKSDPGNLNEDDIYTALEDIEKDTATPQPMYFTLERVSKLINILIDIVFA